MTVNVLKLPREIQMIVVHCSDSKWGDAEVIDGWHRQRGFDSCGYHAVICNGFAKGSKNYNPHDDGLIQPGRDPSVQGAHVRGHNQTSLGVCLIGIDEFTPKQFEALTALLGVWTAIYSVPADMVLGHNVLDSKKTCPNFGVQEWYLPMVSQ